MNPTLRHRLEDQQGTAVVEMALVLPLLLVVVLGILDFGKAFNYWNDVNHLAAEAARYAAVDRSPDGGDLKTYIKGRADTPELRARAQVCISFPSGSSNVGDPVRVTVTAPYDWVPFLDAPPAPLSGIRTTTNLTGTAEHRLEVAPSYSAGCTSA